MILLVSVVLLGMAGGGCDLELSAHRSEYLRGRGGLCEFTQQRDYWWGIA